MPYVIPAAWPPDGRQNELDSALFAMSPSRSVSSFGSFRAMRTRTPGPSSGTISVASLRELVREVPHSRGWTSPRLWGGGPIRCRISIRASRRALFGRGAVVAVHARRAASPCRTWPMGRPAGRREHRRHAGHARTRDPVRSVRVPDQLRRRTRDPGRGHRRRPPRPRAAAARRGIPQSGMSPATRTPRSSISSAAWPGACA
jgi:hypothetical protein